MISKSELERLIILIEECSEIQKAATKAIRHGWTATDPHTGKHYNNKADLESEIMDFIAVLGSLVESNSLSSGMFDSDGLDKHIEKLEKYLHFK